MELFRFLYIKLEKLSVKKKNQFIFLLVILIDFLSIISFVNAFYVNFNFLKTDKTIYFIDEDIKINASWELSYDINNENSYVQVQIFNGSDIKIWNSPEYDEIGFFEKNWTVNLQQLNIDFTNYSNILYIKFFSYYKDFFTSYADCTFLDAIKIKVIKRKPLCELTGYRDRIKYGDCLYLTAKFYDDSSESNLFLINYSIQFKIYSNNFISYQSTYTTNLSGMVDLCLNSLTYLNLGQNFLVFSIIDSRIYNDTKFIYELCLEKNQLIIDIISFNESLIESEDLEIRLFCYYYFNQSLKPLAIYNIVLKIYDYKTLIYINEYKTDKFGVLTIKIPQKSFNFNLEGQEFNINIIFNGTNFLNNKTLSLSLKINRETYSDKKNSLQMSILSFMSILIIILIVLSFIISNKKNKSKKLLTDLIIRY